MKANIKKTISLIVALICVLSVAFAMTGCKKKKDLNVLSIKVYKAGYGDMYVHAWIEDFEKIYEKEGYRVEIEKSNLNITGSTVTNEMVLGKNNTVDLYVTGNLAPYALKRASDNLDMDMIAANLNDVFDSYPTKKDGTQEKVKIADKLLKGYAQYFKLGNDYYAFPYYTAPFGLVVNPEAFKEHVGNVDYPRTTDEFLKMVDKVADKAEADKNLVVRPFAFAGKNAFSYLYGVEDVWVAQYEGLDYYKAYTSLDNVKNAEEAGALYDRQGWKESLKVIKEMQQTRNVMPGSAGAEHSLAQADLVKGRAVFMVNGAWLQNEMYNNFAADVVKMEMIKTPIISALGTKIGLKDDATLSKLVALIDDGKTYNEAKTQISGLTETQYNAVKDARNIFYDWGVPAQILINAYSPNVELAKKFLRYVASDDAARRAFAASTLLTPYASSEVDISADANRYTNFIRSFDQIRSGQDAKYIYRQMLGTRADNALGFFNHYTSLEVTWLTQGTLTVDDVITAEKEKIEELWEDNIGNR